MKSILKLIDQAAHYLVFIVLAPIAGSGSNSLFDQLKPGFHGGL